MGGASLAIVATIMALMVWLPLVSAPSDVGPERGGVRNVIDLRQMAMGLLVQQQALQSWHADNPGSFGEVATASLPVAAPWSPVASARSVVQTAGGQVIGVTYYGGDRFRTADLVSALTEAAEYSGNVGLTSAAGLVSPRGTVVPLPAGVPIGVAAVAMVLE